MTIRWIARDRSETLKDIVEAHLSQSMQQAARVFQHDARLLALIHQLRDELSHPLVAPVKNRSVMVVTDPWVIHHRLEIADNSSTSQVITASRDQRLVHVQRIGKTAVDLVKVDRTV
jgi:hypothetical protein